MALILFDLDYKRRYIIGHIYMLYCEICFLQDIYNDTSDRNEIRFDVSAYLRMYSECGIFDFIYVQ